MVKGILLSPLVIIGSRKNKIIKDLGMKEEKLHDRYDEKQLESIRSSQKEYMAFEITSMLTDALKYYDIELLPEAQNELMGKSNLFVYQILKEYRSRALLKGDGAK